MRNPDDNDDIQTEIAQCEHFNTSTDYTTQ